MLHIIRSEIRYESSYLLIQLHKSSPIYIIHVTVIVNTTWRNLKKEKDSNYIGVLQNDQPFGFAAPNSSQFFLSDHNVFP
jgi:hypothetical protein